MNIAATRPAANGHSNIAVPPSCCLGYLYTIAKRITATLTDIFRWIGSFFYRDSKPSLQTQSITAPPPRVNMVPIGPTEQFLNFYRNEGEDAEGRTLGEILAWNDDALERVHNYIQWLFPSVRRSDFNPRGPLIREEMVEAFRNDPGLRNQLLNSFNRMLAFYGLRLNEAQVAINRDQNAPLRQAVWLTPRNHNFLRITRILGCLNRLSLPAYAAAFHRILTDIAENEGRNIITPATLRCWRSAAALPE